MPGETRRPGLPGLPQVMGEWVVTLLMSKQIGVNDRFLEPLQLPLKRKIDAVLKKLLGAFPLTKFRALDNALHLTPDLAV